MVFSKIGRLSSLVAASILVSSGSSSAGSASLDRGVFAFMPHFVFDTSREIFLNGKRGDSYPLRLCSTDGDVCIQSTDFRFKFPRNCDARRAFFSNPETNQNTLISVVQKTHHSSEKLYLLSDPDFPSYGLLVGEKGIAAVIYNPIRPVSEVATEESLGAALAGNAANFSFGRILSAVPFGGCTS